MAELIVLPDKVKVQLAIEAVKRSGYGDTATKEASTRKAIQTLNAVDPEELIVRGLVASLKEEK